MAQNAWIAAALFRPRDDGTESYSPLHDAVGQTGGYTAEEITLDKRNIREL